MTILLIYISLTLLIATRLGWVMVKQLDAFDWHYRRGDVWTGFWLGILLWPVLLIFKPSLILKGTAVKNEEPQGLDFTGSLAAQRRRIHQLIESPPLCGAQVSYDFPSGRDSDGTVEMIFNAADIQSHFKGKALPLFWEDEQVAIVKFITGRDDTVPGPTPVPEAIDFEKMATQLIDAGIGTVRCVACKVFYKAGELSQSTPEFHPGWNFADYSCPAGHSMLTRKHTHVYARRD